jgi:hypothetical protein
MEKIKILELQNKIIDGLKASALQLMETKRKNNQKIVISTDGEIKIITP